MHKTVTTVDIEPDPRDYQLVRQEYAKAVEKHPEFPEPWTTETDIMLEEFGEISKALNEQDPEQAYLECSHLIVTTFRRMRKLRMQIYG